MLTAWSLVESTSESPAVSPYFDTIVPNGKGLSQTGTDARVKPLNIKASVAINGQGNTTVDPPRPKTAHGRPHIRTAVSDASKHPLQADGLTKSQKVVERMKAQVYLHSIIKCNANLNSMFRSEGSFSSDATVCSGASSACSTTAQGGQSCVE